MRILVGSLSAGLLSLSASANAGLIAFYPFSGNANDAVGTKHGVVNGATLSASGYEGQGYSFNGTSNNISISTLDINPSVHPTLTMGAWVNASSGTAIRQVISHDNGGFDRSLGIDNRGGGTGWSAFSGSGSVLGFSPVALSTWTFVAVSYDQTASQVKLYVDGNQFSETGTLSSGLTTTRIGSNPSFVEFFSGTIDNVFFFDHVLSSTEISTIRTGGEAAIMAYVPEPGSVVMVLAAALGLRRRKRR